MSTVLRACDGLPIKEFAAGEPVIFVEGSPAGVLYILADGAVEVAKGDVQITTVSEPGAFFGEMSALLDAPHTATVRALAPSSFRVADDRSAFMHAAPGSRARARPAARPAAALRPRLPGRPEASVRRTTATTSRWSTRCSRGWSTTRSPASAPGSDRCPDPTVE